MKPSTYETIKRIRDKHGPSEFGKIAQKLLGIALCRLCFEVKERSVQDVDIEAIRNELKYAIEVKTTDKDKISIAEKDVSGLVKWVSLHGGETWYAVLKVSILSDWIIASSRNIKTGTIRIGRLSASTISPLQNDVNNIFPSIVKEFGDKILSATKGQAQWVADKLLKTEIEKKKDKVA